jgi:hypothetical protein
MGGYVDRWVAKLVAHPLATAALFKKIYKKKSFLINFYQNVNNMPI